MQVLQYRPMRLEDIPRVHEIDVLSFSLPWPEKSYHFELTENPNSLAIVAELVSPEADPGIIGMSVVWIIEDEAHIATIAIHPHFRGHGHGKKLLSETLRQSHARGAELATLEVREKNMIAQRMYLEFGFKIVGRREKYYKDNNEDALIMTLFRMGSEFLARLETL